VIEGEIVGRLHNELSASYCGENRCQEKTSEDGQS
jgi:hypothetical protein